MMWNRGCIIIIIVITTRSWGGILRLIRFAHASGNSVNYVDPTGENAVEMAMFVCQELFQY